MAQGILETILANQILILNHLGITPAASEQALTGQQTATNTTAGVATGSAPANVSLPGNTPTNITTSTTDVDAAGLPWDERIHSSSKEKLVKDNTWKLKRGVDKNLVAQIEAEYRAAGFLDTRNAVNAPVGGAAVQTPVPPTNTAAVPGAGAAVGGGLPGLPGGMPAPVTTPPAPVKVEMPVYTAGVDIDDTLLTTIASAFYAEWGEANLLKALELFQLPAGSPVTAISDPAHRDSFWRLVTTPQYLEQYQFVKPQA